MKSIRPSPAERSKIAKIIQIMQLLERMSDTKTPKLDAQIVHLTPKPHLMLVPNHD